MMRTLLVLTFMVSAFMAPWASLAAGVTPGNVASLVALSAPATVGVVAFMHAAHRKGWTV